MNLRTFLRSYATLWTVTLTIGAIVAVVPGLSSAARHALALSFTSPHDSASDAAAIWIRNSATCLIPIGLFRLTDPSRGGLRVVLPAGINFAAVAPSLVLVGAAIGAYGDRLFPYLIHLPLEWGALAIGLSLWPAALHGPIPRRTLGAAALLTLAIAAAAAFVEVYVTR